MRKNERKRGWIYLILLMIPLVLSGCYANTPTIEGIDDFPDYPTASVSAEVSPSVNIPATESPPDTSPSSERTPDTAASTSPANTVVVLNSNTPIVVTPSPTVITAASSGTPTPSNILKRGVNGNNVRDLQSKLKELGYYKGTVDGDFGEGTEEAVKAFQRDNKLTADGIAGIETLRKLASARATVKPTNTPTPRPTEKPSYNENTYLKVGSSGTLVTRLQNRLIELGYLTGKATGDYDATTESAVIAFQKRNTSYWDGIAGKLTLDALFSSSAKGTSTSVGIIGSSLSEGSSGSIVRSLQQRLKELGYYSGSVDGSFGSSTREAVIAFQKANGLTADGKAGSATLNKLNSASAISANSGTLEEGSTGTEVSVLQNRLKNLGYYDGNIDGSFGASTKAAVEAFQRRNGLTADGKVGEATSAKLYSSTAVAASTTLELGSTGSDVVRLQQRLKDLGYYNGSVDGDFGQSTQSAVLAFQRRNGLTVDGKAGRSTQETLYSSSALRAPTATPTVRPTVTPRVTQTPYPDNIYVLVTAAPDGSYVTLRRGNYGNLVTTMQQALQSRGYYSDTIDGYFGESTENAVKSFQKDKGLNQDGVAGPATLRVLFEGDFPIGS